MRISSTIVYVALALLGSKLPAKADIIAFTGDQCDGDEGENVPCSDECIDFNGRHSFEVVATGTHCVVAFEDGACSIPVGEFSNGGSGACSNVNTGTTVLSLRCSPNFVCDDILGNTTSLAKALPTLSSA
ncbi:hypothetical protein CPB84DRAFT_1750838 [Gymnopilus junonius]|uniref:Uncharacterized protein n=1 Tax=Gymnopilus junonius TaxID=109634 RepID=A0A9P5NCZ2_GYMJU|nr:hypothetical protein CPB84DRAFT_1750838 [Gymnopilus junonius]